MEKEEIKDEEGKIIGVAEKHYNEKGLLTKEIRTDREGNITRERSIEYDYRGMAVRETDKEGKSLNITERDFDKEGRKLKEESNSFYEGIKTHSLMEKIDRKREYKKEGGYIDVEETNAKRFSGKELMEEEKFLNADHYDKDGRRTKDFRMQTSRTKSGDNFNELQFNNETTYKDGKIKESNLSTKENGSPMIETRIEHDYLGQERETLYEKWDAKTGKTEKWLEKDGKKEKLS